MPGGSARAAELNWGDPADITGPFSLVLGADLVYAVADVQPLVQTLDSILGSNPGSALLMAHCSRSSEVDQQLFDSFAGAGLKLQRVAASDNDRRVSVTMVYHRDM